MNLTYEHTNPEALDQKKVQNTTKQPSKLKEIVQERYSEIPQAAEEVLKRLEASGLLHDDYIAKMRAIPDARERLQTALDAETQMIDFPQLQNRIMKQLDKTELPYSPLAPRKKPTPRKIPPKPPTGIKGFLIKFFSRSEK